jgi:hypothetical protein
MNTRCFSFTHFSLSSYFFYSFNVHTISVILSLFFSSTSYIFLKTPQNVPQIKNVFCNFFFWSCLKLLTLIHFSYFHFATLLKFICSFCEYLPSSRTNTSLVTPIYYSTPFQKFLNPSLTERTACIPQWRSLSLSSHICSNCIAIEVRGEEGGDDPYPFGGNANRRRSQF